VIVELTLQRGLEHRHLYAIRDAPTLDAARAAADRLVNTDRREFPAAVACFETAE
jgi:hypothetical protein